MSAREGGDTRLNTIADRVSVSVSDYLHPEASGLLAKVDFGGLIRDMTRGAALGIISIAIGGVLAVRNALGEVAAELEAYRQEVVTGLFGVPSETVAAAAEVSGGELDMFGLFALPVGATVALVTVGGVLVVGIVFWGWRD